MLDDNRLEQHSKLVGNMLDDNRLEQHIEHDNLKHSVEHNMFELGYAYILDVALAFCVHQKGQHWKKQTYWQTLSQLTQ